MLVNLFIFSAVLGVFGLGNYIFGGGAERKSTLKRIDRIKKRRIGAKVTATDVSLRRKKNEPKGFIHWLMKPLPNFSRLGARMERAGMTITPKQFVLRRLLILGIILFLCVLFNKSPIMGLSLGIIFAVWLPLQIMKFKVTRQNKAFLRLFPDAIDLIVRGLRSGLPVSESMLLVAQEVPDPVKSVFANVNNTMRLGVSLEKALQEAARRLDMTEFNFFTTSIVLQRETGGNLSEILNNLSEVLRLRFLMRMKIKAMSSEARASSYIIGALPFVVLGAVSFFAPAYMKPLITDYRGNVCAAVAAGMMISGMWVMNRMTQFEI